MERSGSQKALLVFSIIEIVGAVFAFLGGFAAIIGTAAIGSLSSADLASAGVTANQAATAGGVGAILSILLIIMGIWSLLCGIFGIRAANDASKIGIVWIFTLIDLVMCVVGLVITLVQGGFQWSLLLTLIMSGVMFWLANNIKKESTY